MVWNDFRLYPLDERTIIQPLITFLWQMQQAFHSFLEFVKKLLNQILPLSKQDLKSEMIESILVSIVLYGQKFGIVLIAEQKDHLQKLKNSIYS